MSDCPCKAIPATGDPKGHVTASAGVAGLSGEYGQVDGTRGRMREDPEITAAGAAPVKRKRAPKVLKGQFCVVSVKTGRAFNCFHAEETAERMAGRLGARFKVQKKK